MTIQEAIKTGKPFKRKGWNFYLECQKSNYSGNLCFYLQCTRTAYTLSGDDILADDWEVLEKWYEGDFEKKYPNGVLCWVWESFRDFKIIRVIKDYNPQECYPFLSQDNYRWSRAKPIKPSEAPAIIGEEDD